MFLAICVQAQLQISDFSYESVRESQPISFIEFNNLMFFIATTDGYGREIWFSDGTSSNTRLLKDINPGEADGARYLLTKGSAVLNNELYFIATDGSSNGEIWKTDGTSSGTSQVTDFLDGRVSELVSVNDNIFFTLENEANLLQVWKSDGTEEGTVLVKNDLSIWNSPTFRGKCNDTFIFTFQPFGSNRTRVWRSDGTSEGTYALTGEIDGNGSSENGTTGLSQYIEYKDKLYFVDRFHLYETDGIIATIVAPLWNAAINFAEFSDVIEVNNNLYFLFFSADSFQLEIWESDGSSENTKEIYNNFATEYFFPSNLSVSNNSLIFSGSNESGGTSLISLSLDDFSISNLFELSESPEAPFLFGAAFNACKIYEIAEDELFLSLPQNDLNEKEGWVLDIKANTFDNVNSLKNIRDAIVYDQALYYAKDNQLWKYTSTILSSQHTKLNPNIAIYPNPSNNYINIETKNPVKRVNLFDVRGNLVLSKSEFDRKKIDISELSYGVYTVNIITNENVTIRKIVKK